MQTDVVTTTETLGSRILAELARRQATGYFFTYRQRQQIRCIDDRATLRATLKAWKFGEVDTSGNEQQIVDAIGVANAPKPSTLLLLGLLDILLFRAPLFSGTAYILGESKKTKRPS